MKTRTSALIAILSVVLAAQHAAGAPDADSPPFVTDSNGVFDIPWGAGHWQWPEQLFFEAMGTADYPAMQGSAAGISRDGKVPVFSAVTWGDDLTQATGAKANQPGFQQFGAWYSTRARYLAVDRDGNVFWPGAGHISPMMPLDATDWPAGIPNATFGDWSADRLGTLAVAVGIRGLMAADFIEGLADHSFDGTIDFNPRVVDAFVAWSGEAVPAGSVPERAAYVRQHLWSRWHDYLAEAYASFYARVATTIESLGGGAPLVGAQTHLDPARRRWCGTDYRIYLKHLPREHWYFQIELQSDSMRPVPPMWQTSTKQGLFACREPDLLLGSHMDADHPEFWNAVHNLNQQSDDWGRRYLKHHWLSVGWEHVATRDGAVRRGTGAFYRHYWDSGNADPATIAVVRGHIPRHPFGPAVYYSVAIERSFEDEQSSWNVTYDAADAVLKGAPVGYFVSDAALDSLQPASYPSAWLVYDQDRLPAAERAKLTAIAPIVDAEQVKSAGPIAFTGSLTGFAFVDQNDDVVLLVGNPTEQSITETVSLKKVKDGSYRAVELFDSSSTAFTVGGGAGIFSVTLGARESRAFAIAGLYVPAANGAGDPGADGGITPVGDSGAGDVRTDASATTGGCGCSSAGRRPLAPALVASLALVLAAMTTGIRRRSGQRGRQSALERDHEP